MRIKSPAFWKLVQHEQEKWRPSTCCPMSWSSQELGDHRVSFTLSHWRMSWTMAPINHVGVVTLPLYEVRCGHSASAIFLQKRLALLLSPPAVLLEEMLNYLTQMRITGCESWSGRLTCLQHENRWLISSVGYNLRNNHFQCFLLAIHLLATKQAAVTALWFWAGTYFQRAKDSTQGMRFVGFQNLALCSGVCPDL